MIHAAGQGEKPFEGIGNVRFDLLRRHAGIKRSYDDDGNVDGRKKVNRHTHEGHGANDGHHEAGDDN